MIKPLKPPFLLAAGAITIRINPRTSPTSYLHLQIMEPPEYNDQGEFMREGSVTVLYLSMEHARLLADAIYAQDVLDLVE